MMWPGHVLLCRIAPDWVQNRLNEMEISLQILSKL
jgi:hypothetical protein